MRPIRSAILICLLVTPSLVSSGDRPILAVFNVEAQRLRMPKALQEGLSDYLATQLMGTGRYQVIPRDQLKVRLVQQKKHSYRQCYDQKCQIELGKELAAEKTLSTKIIKLGKNCTVNLTLYDLQKAAAESASSVKGGCTEDDLVESIDAAVKKLVETSEKVAKKEVKVAPPAGPKKPEVKPGKAGIEWVLSKPAGVEFTRTEVTISQYRACVEEGTCPVPMSKKQEKMCNWGYTGRDNHPIGCVIWSQADTFCKWAGGRLPTDDEWEREATFLGTRKYPWGDDPANCDRTIVKQDKSGCGRETAWPVCSKPAGNSVSGLCDMIGNASEMTSTVHMYGTQKNWGLRGGGWIYKAETIHKHTYRGGDSSPRCEKGFRCVRDPAGGRVTNAYPRKADSELIWTPSEVTSHDFTQSEVTVAQYHACVIAGSCTLPSNKYEKETFNWGHPERDDHPVNGVDWKQAKAFCTWAGADLPNSYVWIQEATENNARKYPWGAETPGCGLAVVNKGGPGCGKNSTWPVCSKSKGNSISGLCDMGGNVEEWTKRVLGGETTKKMAVAGGSWRAQTASEFAQGGIRSVYSTWSEDHRGFRCVRKRGSEKKSSSEGGGAKKVAQLILVEKYDQAFGHTAGVEKGLRDLLEPMGFEVTTGSAPKDAYRIQVEIKGKPYGGIYAYKGQKKTQYPGGFIKGILAVGDNQRTCTKGIQAERKLPELKYVDTDYSTPAKAPYAALRKDSQYHANLLNCMAEIMSEAVLVPGLKAERNEFVPALMSILSKTKNEQTLEAIYRLYLDSDKRSQAKLMSSDVLSAAGPEVVPHLIKSLSHADKSVRYDAVKWLRKHGDPGAAPALIKALGDPESTVRLFAKQALNRIKAPVPLDILLAIAKDAEAKPESREEAIRLIRDQKDNQAVPTLVELTKDPKTPSRVRAAAKSAIKALNDRTQDFEVRVTGYVAAWPGNPQIDFNLPAAAGFDEPPFLTATICSEYVCPDYSDGGCSPEPSALWGWGYKTDGASDFQQGFYMDLQDGATESGECMQGTAAVSEMNEFYGTYSITLTRAR